VTEFVRDARPGDLPRLRAIQTVTLAEPWPELLAVAVDGPPVCLVYTAPHLDTDTGADSDSVLDSASRSSPTGYALAVADEDAGYLAELAVAEGHRGEGQGSALLDALVDRLRDRGVGTLRVTVRERDERARSFYASHGFVDRERLPDHYEDCDGRLLEREL
jgi:ribosomal-protein-alanine N-acetyltransferase